MQPTVIRCKVSSKTPDTRHQDRYSSLPLSLSGHPQHTQSSRKGQQHKPTPKPSHVLWTRHRRGVQLSVAISKGFEEISVLKRIIACKTKLFIQPRPHFSSIRCTSPYQQPDWDLQKWTEVIATVISLRPRRKKKGNLAPSHFSSLGVLFKP